MITLYRYDPVANPLKVMIALHEKGIDYESRWVDLQNFGQHEPEYLKINPEGQVPTLVHDGEIITQTTVINEYLEDAFPDTPPLRPREPLEIARMRQWNKYIDESVMDGGVSLHAWHNFAGAIARKFPDEEFEALANRIPLKRQEIKWRTARVGFPQETLDEGTAQVVEAVQRVEATLEKGPWLLGDFYSLADINFFAYCGFVLELLFPQLADRAKHPRVMDWIDRVRARPKVAEALAVKPPQ